MTEIPLHKRSGLPADYFPSGAGDYRAIPRAKNPYWDINPSVVKITMKTALNALQQTKPYIRRGVLNDLINLKDAEGYTRHLAHEVLLLVVKAEFNDELLRKLWSVSSLGENLCS